MYGKLQIYTLRGILLLADSLSSFLPRVGDDFSRFSISSFSSPFSATRIDSGWNVDLYFACRLKTTTAVTLSKEPGYPIVNSEEWCSWAFSPRHLKGILKKSLQLTYDHFAQYFFAS